MSPCHYCQMLQLPVAARLACPSCSACLTPPCQLCSRRTHAPPWQRRVPSVAPARSPTRDGRHTGRCARCSGGKGWWTAPPQKYRSCLQSRTGTCGEKAQARANQCLQLQSLSRRTYMPQLDLRARLPSFADQTRPHTWRHSRLVQRFCGLDNLHSHSGAVPAAAIHLRTNNGMGE